MKQETLDFVVEKTNELINSATCCDELKELLKKKSRLKFILLNYKKTLCLLMD